MGRMRKAGTAVERFKVSQSECLKKRKIKLHYAIMQCFCKGSQRIVQQHWNILKSDPNPKSVFKKPNIHDLKVRADLPPERLDSWLQFGTSPLDTTKSYTLKL